MTSSTTDRRARPARTGNDQFDSSTTTGEHDRLDEIAWLLLVDWLDEHGLRGGLRR